MAVSVGLVLARAERRRRADGQHPHDPHDHELGLLAGEPLPAALRRMALGQVDLALELLGADDGAGAAPDEVAVHDTRKAIKRLRALLRVLRHELGERGVERENAALRDIARRLSGSRDATVMLATLDALVKRHPRTLGRRRGVRALRRRLAAESARVQTQTLADPAERAEVLGELHAFRWRVSAWSLPAGDGLGLIDADLERLYRQGRSRQRRVARGKGERTLALHMWRKRVKDLRYVAEMLERRDNHARAAPGGRGKSGKSGKSGGARTAGGADARLRKIAARADELGELLGEEHDLAVLAEHLRTREGLWRAKRGTRRALLQAIAQRRRKLRRRALRKGRRLYGETPARFMRGVRAGYS
ncbi:MAG TPA: CHAD domain-containing protein [Solirubrobacteraceae bacterium]|nr:CHAD domain-containing protein [Solirubrobacteraceae bacterium]